MEHRGIRGDWGTDSPYFAALHAGYDYGWGLGGLPGSPHFAALHAGYGSVPSRERHGRPDPANIGRLDELVEEAGEIIIGRRGRPIARLLPMTGQRQRPDHADLRQRMAKLVTPLADLLRSECDER